MQVDASISVFSSGNYTSPTTARNAGSQAAASGLQASTAQAVSQYNLNAGAALTELPAQPAISALASDGGAETSVLRESTGSGSVPTKIAAAIYALNLSFDIQAQALDLLA